MDRKIIWALFIRELTAHQPFDPQGAPVSSPSVDSQVCRRKYCGCVCRVSAPCDCFIELCTAVLNCERATHGLPADRAPVYRGCPDRDPLGCPLIPRQGQTANPLAAATAETDATAARVRARPTQDKQSQTVWIAHSTTQRDERNAGSTLQVLQIIFLPK